VPANHRPDDSQCATVPGPGDCSFQGQGGPDVCSSDSQCTTGTNGRCIPDGPIAGCRCTYDTCSTDTDCPTGQLCACHGAAFSDGAGNTCTPGNCRVDADCGANGYCSPSTASESCGGLQGYYCHTPNDACVNDSDCGSELQDCEWSSEDSRWECKMVAVCA
jgi:hypothetical protein